jgi:3-oxoacyl-[acyl-carrier protein] reductase
VTANLVIPGPIDGTGMTTDTDPAFVEGIRRRIPLQRLGHASEVAHAVRFLLDDDAAFITGTSIVVDGGLSM